MHDPQTFESRVRIAYDLWASEMPTELDELAFVRATRDATGGHALNRWPARRLRLAFVLVLLVAIALVAGVLVGTRPLPTRHYSNVFTPVAPMAVARVDHTATLLRDGRVLVVGGWGNDEDNEVNASAEIWDPVMQSFSPAASLGRARTGHTATLLSDGRVLIVGGWGVSGYLSQAEIWDPVTQTFNPAASLSVPRGGHTATLLPDGRVLVVGGEEYWSSRRKVPGSAEIWDPTTEAFSPVASPGMARFGHTATLLTDGRVLVVGAYQEPGTSSVIWDPATQTISGAASLGQSRAHHTATLLRDGSLLVVGGFGNGVGEGALPSSELWDPATQTFSDAASLAHGRDRHTATLLPDGRVLIAGGGLAEAELWDPATQAFSLAASLDEPRSGHTATLLPDGRVLLVGGGSEAALFE